MAFWRVRVRVRQPFDIVLKADDQASAEALAIQFQNSPPNQDIILIQDLKSPDYTVVGSQQLPDDPDLAKRNIRRFLDLKLDSIEDILSNPDTVIDSAESEAIKIKINELLTLVDSSKG